MNRLANATSPYLLQHADNPVDWWPWGPEALAEARRRDVPLLISVGYAACHWCHVMAHESFEDPEVAEVVNQLTVPVKVDREERPDIDAVYMTATQAMTGQGGWPMTVFATPDGEPFICGTYFPRDQFLQLVEAVGRAWRERRDSLLQRGRAVARALSDGRSRIGRAPLSEDLLDAAAATLHREHDPVNGGFGDAPKFPPSMCLEFLLRHYARTGHARSLEVVRYTCERMARGGMYDQLAGGFARYSVDAAWVVPHFEKMLYDNALLTLVYTHLWRVTADPLARRVAEETVRFLLRDLATPEGGFASSLDADTEGVEGATYVWTPAQLTEVLGPEDGVWAAEVFGVTVGGTFEHGTSVLQLPADPSDSARFRRVRQALLRARRGRPQPARDDKVVAAWNGLAITALVEFAAIARAMLSGGVGADSAHTLDSETESETDTLALARQALEAAQRAGSLLADVHLVDGRLRRVSRHGVVGDPPGVAEDHGCVAEAFCALHQITGEPRWLELAGQLLDVALAHFGDGMGGFYDTADDAEALVARPADPTDNASPSGLTSLAGALTSYAALRGSPRHREAARTALSTVAPLVQQHARFTGWACAVGEAQLAGPAEVAVVTTASDPADDPLWRTAWLTPSPGAVIVAGRPDQPGVPLLAGREYRSGLTTAYVCRDFVCQLPVTDPAALTAQLTGR